MVAVVILAVSMVAFAQFGLYYWRATISGIAAKAISERIRTAAGITHTKIGPRDFRSILIVKDLSPDLQGPGGSFAAIRAYYAVIEKVGKVVPAMSNWADAEMATCSRYIAVLMDQHLERNIVCAAQVRNM